MAEKKGKIAMKRVWITLVSLVLVTGFILLFIAASDQKKEGSCKGMVIAFTPANGSVYVDTAGIRKQLLSHKALNPLGKPISQLDLPLLEQSVQTHAWVKAAEVYVGNHDLLHIKITQKVPVARVFTTRGSSFYLDQDGMMVPAAGQFTVTLPVFTGYPAPTKARPADSSLLQQIAGVSTYIATHPFWMAQIEQVNINDAGEFELIPQLGDALILLGKGDQVARKLDKLLTFYQAGLNNVGWGYYDTLDIRYANQVIGSRKPRTTNPVITALVTHNDPEHLKEVREMIADQNSPTTSEKTVHKQPLTTAGNP